MNNTILRLKTGATETVALRFPQGKPVEGQFGPQVMYTLTDGRTMYADPALAEALAALGVAAGEPVAITRQGKQYEVQRTQQPRPDVSSAAQPVRAAAPRPGIMPLTTYTGVLAASYATAIDAMAQACAYAEVRGVAFEPSSEDIRATALTIAIQAFKAAGVVVPQQGGAQWQQ